MFVFAASGHGRAQSNDSAPPQQTQQQQPKTKPAPSPVPEKPKQKADTNYYNANCNSAHGREDDDLCQQRRMAQAAEDAVWWAAFQTKLGVAGFVGVVLSLFFTGWAAIAASRQVRLSRHALVTTDRAFVHIKSFGSERVVDPAQNNRIIGWNIFVELENAGNTPTRWCRVSFNFEFREAEIPNDFDFPEMDNPAPPRWFLLAPKGGVFSGKKFFNMERAGEVASKARHLYYWGWVEYNDVFENTPRHRTEFAYKINFVGGRYPEFASIAAEPTPRHNAADDECLHGIMSQPPLSER